MQAPSNNNLLDENRIFALSTALEHTFSIRAFRRRYASYKMHHQRKGKLRAKGRAPLDHLATLTQEGIGRRIHFLRRQRKITLEQLSESSRLTKSFISKIERGVSVPSISTAMKLAKSFNLTVSQLLGEGHYDDAVSLVRKSERRSFMRPGSSSGYDYEMIASPKRFKRMEPYIMKPPLKFQDNNLFEHTGEELMFVLSGSVEVELADRKFLLSQGDALYFDSHLPHRSRSLGGKYAQVLVVVTES